MTTCSESLERLPLFVGGELEALDAARVQEHLGQCESCAREEAALQAASQRFRDTVSPPASVTADLNLWAGVRASMVSEGLLQGAEPANQDWELRPVAPAAPKLSLLRKVGSFAAAAAVIATASLAGSGLLSTGQDSSVGQPLVAEGSKLSQMPGDQGEAEMRLLLPGEASLSMNSRNLRPVLQPSPYQETFPVNPGYQGQTSLAGFQNFVTPGASLDIELR